MSHLLSIWVWKLQETLDFGVLKASMSFSGKCPSNKTSLFSFCILLFHPFPTLCQLLYPPVFTVFFSWWLTVQVSCRSVPSTSTHSTWFRPATPCKSQEGRTASPNKGCQISGWPHNLDGTFKNNGYLGVISSPLKRNDAGLKHLDCWPNDLRCLCSRISTWVSCEELLPFVFGFGQSIYLSIYLSTSAGLLPS